MAWNASVPGIILNTVLAAIWGAIATTMLKYLIDGYIDVLMIINGALGGLVSITANCHIVSPVDAMFIGIVGGLFVFYGERLLEWKKIDDAIGVVPVHLFAGIWGTLAVALFGNPEKIGASFTLLEQLWVQAIGVASIGFYSFFTSYVLFRLINRFYALRIDAQSELIGLNVAEHRVSTEVFDLLAAMQHQHQNPTSHLGYR